MDLSEDKEKKKIKRGMRRKVLSVKQTRINGLSSDYITLVYPLGKRTQGKKDPDMD